LMAVCPKGIPGGACSLQVFSKYPPDPLECFAGAVVGQASFGGYALYGQTCQELVSCNT